MTDTQPTPGQEHPAIWLMRRISRFLKWTVIVIVVLVIVGGGGIWAYIYWTETLPTSQIKITVNKDGRDPRGEATCKDPAYPLFILIFNDSRWTLTRVSFRLTAKKPRYSTDFVTGYAYSTDYITEPGIGGGGCWAIPSLSDASVNWRDLDWSAKVSSAQFE